MATSKRKTPYLKRESNRFRQRLADLLFLGILGLCLLSLLALTTYSSDDPGWSSSGAGTQISNRAGLFGAYLADIFFSLLGMFAFLIPILLGHRAFVILLQKNDARGLSDFLVRMLGLIGLLTSGSALLTMSISDNLSLPQGAGGIVGASLDIAITGFFSEVGARLLLTFVALGGLTIYANLNWLNLVDRLGGAALYCTAQIIRLKNSILTRREERRERERRIAKVRARAERDRLRGPLNIATPHQPPERGARAQREQQKTLFDMAGADDMPPLDLLDNPPNKGQPGYSQTELESMSRLLEIKLADFGIAAEVVSVFPGPVVTRFEIQPAAGVKVSRILNLAKDLARSLAVISVRVVEVIPGKSVVGIEIPNANRKTVNFREVLSSRVFDESKSPMTLALGHDISGSPIVADLARMPHLLVAGTTGSGKSVGVNCMLVSLLYKATPNEVRLILVDPKMLELSVYDGIPHLLTPVITDMKDAANGLRWCVAEMERRYKLMSLLGVRNLSGYNRKINEAKQVSEPILDPLWTADPVLELTDEYQQAPLLQTLPNIVVVIDEFADMMMIVGKKVEELIARIAQKARAAGIHLILATQRPSVDVITGLIKANIPTRIAFSVSSKIDSRTILDQGGAEQLLGYGDMLYLPSGSSTTTRIHGAFCSDEEVHRVVADWRKRGEPDYIEGLLDSGEQTPVTVAELQSISEQSASQEVDELYDDAVFYVCKSRRASISSIQRKLRIGYNRAARLVETMEISGVVSPIGNNGQREVLAPPPVED